MGQHYEVAMSTLCHKSVPTLIWSHVLLGRKTTTNKQILEPYRITNILSVMKMGKIVPRAGIELKCANHHTT